jgi:hypothetical protein
MPFWPTVIAALVGTPFVLAFTGMGAIFAAAGLANGGRDAVAKAIVGGWLAFAWVALAVFGAFGLAPAWRAWHGGVEDFADGLRVFAGWLGGVGGAGLLAAAALVARARRPLDGGR